MRGQAEVHSVPDIRELRVVVHFLGVHGDASEKGEGFREVFEPEASGQGLPAFFEAPAVGYVAHRRDFTPHPSELAMERLQEQLGREGDFNGNAGR